MSDGIHIPAGTAGEEPGRTLRNLKEPWEPLRTWRRVREGRTGCREGRPGCTDPPQAVYVPQRPVPGAPRAIAESCC
nr:MAG TPA: hypothetical protein [Caudoviricetes sp.]